MDFSNKICSPNSGRSDSQRRSPKINRKTSHESKENSFSPGKTSHHPKTDRRNSKSPFSSPLLHKRILTEKNNVSKSSKKPSPQKKTDGPLPVVSSIGSAPDSSFPLPYDPVTNYTSPRPAFLRYDPNRRMEIMLRVEKAILDEEERASPCNSSVSSSPEQVAEELMQEEERLQFKSSMSAAPQAQQPVSEEEECLSDEEEEEEEGTRNTKLGLKMLFLLLCLVSSVCYISSMGGSNLEMELHARTSEVNVLGEMLGLSEMCLSRRNAELTCGVEEWSIAMEESKKFSPKTGLPSQDEMFSCGELEFDMIGTPEDQEDAFTGNELGITKENDGTETDIGRLAQVNNVESEEVELHAVEHADVFERSETFRMQVYYMQALAGLLLFVIALIASCLRKHTINKLYRRRRPNRASKTDVQSGLGVEKKPNDETSTTSVGTSKMYVIQTAEVDLLVKSSLTGSASTGDGSCVKKVELRSTPTAPMVKSSVKKVELQATPTAATTPQASLENTEKNKNSSEATANPVRRSSRLRSRLTSS